MADETKTTEEAVEEVTEEVVEETTEETTGEIPKEILDANADFDKKLDGDDDDSAVEEEVEDDGEEEVVEKDTAKEDATKQTAEDKEIEAEAKALEEEILKDDAKEVAKKKLATEAEAEVKAEQKSEEDDKPFDCGLSTEDGDEGYDKDLVATINKMGQDGLDRNKALAKENAALQNVINQQANDRYVDFLDRKVAGLGEDFRELLGEGDFEDLEPASDQLENRYKITDRMALVQKTYQKRNQKVPTRSKLFDIAINHLFKETKNKAKTEATTVKKLAKRAGQALGSGSKKSSSTTAATDLAKSNAEFDRKLDED